MASVSDGLRFEIPLKRRLACLDLNIPLGVVQLFVLGQDLSRRKMVVLITSIAMGISQGAFGEKKL